MKTYLLNIPKEIRNYSLKLDVQTLLCCKTWEVFNDEGFKQVFIFQNDNTLLISTNGNVINSTWRFIPTNKTIIITVDGQTTMLHPAFIDETIFALQKDGTEEFLFMIDENRRDVLPSRTIKELGAYFQRCLEQSPTYIEKQNRLKRECYKTEVEKILSDHQEEYDCLLKKKKKRLSMQLVLASLLLLLLIIITIIKGPTIFLIFALIAVFFWFLFVGVFLSDANTNAKSAIIDKYLSKK